MPDRFEWGYGIQRIDTFQNNVCRMNRIDIEILQDRAGVSVIFRALRRDQLNFLPINQLNTISYFDCRFYSLIFYRTNCCIFVI
jgi:hypothetical protein